LIDWENLLLLKGEKVISQVHGAVFKPSFEWLACKTIASLPDFGQAYSMMNLSRLP
jgi:hypothetical protein